MADALVSPGVQCSKARWYRAGRTVFPEALVQVPDHVSLLFAVCALQCLYVLHVQHVAPGSKCMFCGLQSRLYGCEPGKCGSPSSRRPSYHTVVLHAVVSSQLQPSALTGARLCSLKQASVWLKT